MSNTPPTLWDLAPDNSATLVGSGAQACMGFLSSFALTSSIGLSVAGASAAIGGAWIYGRHTSKELRGGNLFWAPKDVKQSRDGFNSELTEYLNKKGLEGAIVTETRSYQHRILQIAHDDPPKMKTLLPALSMRLNVDADNLIFRLNHKKGVSAVMVQLPPVKWKGVGYEKTEAEEKPMQVFFAKAINGAPVIFDHKYDPHGLVVGGTGAGKTELLKTLIHGYRRNIANPIIILIDPKGDLPEYAKIVDEYYDDNEGAVSCFERLAKDMKPRQAKFARSGHANFMDAWEADNSHRPIILIGDEFTDLVQPDTSEVLEKGEIARHKRAETAIWEISRKGRAPGVFMMLAMQSGNAEIAPTKIRGNLSARIALFMSEEGSARAIRVKEAVSLPKLGGLFFLSSVNTAPIMGRAAIVKKEVN